MAERWKPHDLAGAWALGERPRQVWAALVIKPQKMQNPRISQR
jgi:hypothetical protein